MQPQPQQGNLHRRVWHNTGLQAVNQNMQIPGHWSTARHWSSAPHTHTAAQHAQHTCSVAAVAQAWNVSARTCHQVGTTASQCLASCRHTQQHAAGLTHTGRVCLPRPRSIQAASAHHIPTPSHSNTSAAELSSMGLGPPEAEEAPSSQPNGTIMSETDKCTNHQQAQVQPQLSAGRPQQQQQQQQQQQVQPIHQLTQAAGSHVTNGASNGVALSNGTHSVRSQLSTPAGAGTAVRPAGRSWTLSQQRSQVRWASLLLLVPLLVCGTHVLTSILDALLKGTLYGVIGLHHILLALGGPPTVEGGIIDIAPPSGSDLMGDEPAADLTDSELAPSIPLLGEDLTGGQGANRLVVFILQLQAGILELWNNTFGVQAVLEDCLRWWHATLPGLFIQTMMHLSIGYWCMWWSYAAYGRSTDPTLVSLTISSAARLFQWGAKISRLIWARYGTHLLSRATVLLRGIKQPGLSQTEAVSVISQADSNGAQSVSSKGSGSEALQPEDAQPLRSSSVRHMPSTQDSATAAAVYDSTSTETTHDSGSAGAVYDSTSTGTTHDSGSAGAVYDSTSTGTTHDSGSAGAVYDSTSAGSTHDSGSAGAVYDSSTVVGAHDSTAAGATHSSTIAGPKHDSRTTRAVYDSNGTGSKRDSNSVNREQPTATVGEEGQMSSIPSTEQSPAPRTQQEVALTPQPVMCPAADVVVRVAVGLCTLSVGLGLIPFAACHGKLWGTVMGLASVGLSAVVMVAALVYFIKAWSDKSLDFFTQHRHELLSQVSWLLALQAGMSAFLHYRTYSAPDVFTTDVVTAIAGTDVELWDILQKPSAAMASQGNAGVLRWIMPAMALVAGYQKHLLLRLTPVPRLVSVACLLSMCWLHRHL